MINSTVMSVVERKFKRVGVSGKCDVCGSELRGKQIKVADFGSSFDDESRDCAGSVWAEFKTVYDYYRATTCSYIENNNLKGRVVTHDLCSVECLGVFVKKYWLDLAARNEGYDFGYDNAMQIVHMTELVPSHDSRVDEEE